MTHQGMNRGQLLEDFAVGGTQQDAAASLIADLGAAGIEVVLVVPPVTDEFVALLKTFRSEFNKVKSGYQVVYDTTGFIGNYPLEASVGKSAADAKPSMAS